MYTYVYFIFPYKYPSYLLPDIFSSLESRGSHTEKIFLKQAKKHQIWDCFSHFSD